MDNIRGDIAKFSASMKALNAALVTKYSPDQARDDHGRWSDGGGTTTNQARGGRTGKKPPSGAKPAGGKKPKAPTKEAKARAARVKRDAEAVAESMKAARDAANERDRKRAEEAIKERVRDFGNTWGDSPDEVWKEPTFADAVWHALTNFGTILGVSVMNLGSGGGFTSAVVAGEVGGVTATGLYRMMRHLYRKLTITGYQGVRHDSLLDD